MTIFTGIRPSGKLHLGNYFGAIRQIARLQEENDCICSVVDLHAITTEYKADKLKDIIYQNTASWIAGGVDPEKTNLFLQSAVHEHAELMWLLNTITPVGKLQRMIQYKEKSKKQASPKAGILNYPVLMAADILLYDTDTVPVGEDQKQHLEFSRDLAEKFNSRFGEIFKVPEPMIQKSGAKIMSLQDPESKMSKSEPAGCLFLADEPGEIREKIKTAVTDSGRQIKKEPDKPAISNLIEIHELFSEKKAEEIESQFTDAGYAEFKEDLAQVVVKGLSDFRQERKEFLANKAQIKKILLENAKDAQKIAEKKLTEVKKAMGLI